MKLLMTESRVIGERTIAGSSIILAESQVSERKNGSAFRYKSEVNWIGNSSCFRVSSSQELVI